MRIQRTGETYASGALLECHVYVRKDLTAVKASEWYYRYVGENSYLPISDLIDPEDGEVLRKEAEHYSTPVEFLTGITNRMEGYRTVYLRMELSDQTENGEKLYLITLFDLLDMESRSQYLEHQIMKYRHLLGMREQYYFEYIIHDNVIKIYKYMNTKALTLYEMDLDDFAMQMGIVHEGSEDRREDMLRFCSYLKNGTSFFETEFSSGGGKGIVACMVKGGTLYKDRNVIAGILVPTEGQVQEAYYLTPAGRDAGTGVFNKRAITEFVEEKLQQQDGIKRWFLMIDVDDFKNINDSFGHLFGDEVIRTVAEVLQQNIGLRGVIGRFGGDEFFVMLEKVADREELRTLLKTIVKELTYIYDPRLRVMISIGVSQYPKDGSSYEELMGKADKALYIAKEKGKNRHVIYDDALHGDYWKDGMSNRMRNAVQSREERRGAILDILAQINTEGIRSILENGKLLQNVCELYSIDGITIYTNYGQSMVFQWGDYAGEPADAGYGLADEHYVKLFGREGILVESNMLHMKAKHAKAYGVAQSMGIQATIQCLTRKDGIPYALVNFDIFSHNRKWSDAEVETLSLIGGYLGRLLCEQGDVK